MSFLDLRNGPHSYGIYAPDRSKNKLITSHEPGGKKGMTCFLSMGKKIHLGTFTKAGGPGIESSQTAGVLE